MNFYKNKNAYLLMFVFLRQTRHSLIIYLVI